MAAKSHFLTQEWYDKLITELAHLKEVKLPATLERLKEAIAQWDISENAEYDTAMSEKDLIQSRIGEIEEIILNVEIIEHTGWWDIRYWSKVTFVDDKDRKYTVKIVWSGELDIINNEISLESPLWIALRWKAKWDKVAIKAPSRKYMVEILNVD